MDENPRTAGAITQRFVRGLGIGGLRRSPCALVRTEGDAWMHSGIVAGALQFDCIDNFAVGLDLFDKDLKKL